MPPLFRRRRKEIITVNPLEIIAGGGTVKLDINHRYEFQDKTECFWRFTFEAVAGEEGWFAWLRRPHSEEYFCIGKILERDLIERLNSTPPPLTQDDEIDLGLWLLHGGLDQYLPKETKE